MGKKPTVPYGHISFGRDGSVKPHITKLSDKKDEQEIAVGNALAPHANKILNAELKTAPTHEADHDFKFFSGDDLSATVQCTEVTHHDLQPDKGVPVTEQAVIDGKQIGIDGAKRDAALVERIKLKLGKHYPKPEKGEFWLVIWSLSFLDLGEFISDSKIQAAPATVNARKYLQERSAGPFDRVLFFNMQTRPTQIWPAA